MNQSRKFKSDIFDQFARIGKALSSPQRHEILDLLCQGHHTVETLAQKSNLTVANTSRHLQVLKSVRLVESKKNGSYAVYSLVDESVCDFLRSLRFLAESRLAEIEQITREYLTEKDQLEQITQDEIIKRLQQDDTILLDVRPSDEYLGGHIQGALSVPLVELNKRLAELPKDCEFVAYCRGPYCVLAVEAVNILREHGFTAVRLEDGVSDWYARGLPIASGEQA